MSKRGDGQGSITQRADGRHWARAPRQADGQRPSLGIYDTEAEAQRALDIGRAELANARRETTQLFIKFGESVLDQREKEGVRGIEQERYRFRLHLAMAHFANKPIDQVTPADIARWLREMAAKTARRGTGAKKKSYSLGRPLSASTRKRAFALLSAIFDAAADPERNLIASNPCAGLKVKARAGKEATKDIEVFLTLEEQTAIRACPRIPDAERFFILFAFGCGVRKGEQFNLELSDVDVEDACEVTVRFGSHGLPPKNGQVDTIPLFGYALEAARWQIENLERQPNPLNLLWPTRNGHRRKGNPLGGNFRRVETGGTHWYPRVGKNPERAPRGKGTHVYVDRFKELLGFAGITRRVRWHDLRHTCASALLQGQWGDEWKLAEVKELLRHSSVTVTERYAHLGETALKNAAKKVRVGSLLGTDPRTNGGASSARAAISSNFDALELVGRAGHDPATYGLKEQSILEMLRALSEKNVSENPLVTNLATALAGLLASERKS